MMSIPKITKIREGKYAIESPICPGCNKTETVEIDGQSLFRFRQGEKIQDVMPNMSADVRERFMSGYCPPCWTETFGSDDDE